MKKLITANDIRAAHARGEQEMSVVLRASIITPEAREVAALLGVTISECDESTPCAAAAKPITPTPIKAPIIFMILPLASQQRLLDLHNRISTLNEV